MIEKPVYFANNKRILFIDNDMAGYYLVQEIVRESGIEIIHARDGIRALYIFRQYPFFNMIITEIRVPGLDGFEIIYEIRKSNPGIPIIVLTAYVQTGIKEICMEAGINEFITKPAEVELVERVVKRYVE